MDSKYKNRTLKYAWSLIVDQLLAIFAATIITNILGFFMPNGSALLRLVIGGFVFFIICYIDAWGKGSVDSNRVRIGVVKNNAFYGFVFGLVAIIPAWIVAFLAFLAESGFASFYNVIEADIFTVINRFWQFPLSPLFEYFESLPVINLVIPLFVPIVSGFAYLFGFNGISLKRKIVFKDTTK